MNFAAMITLGFQIESILSINYLKNCQYQGVYKIMAVQEKVCYKFNF